jgi:N-acetylmuramoyl-L-alanine amidase
MRKTWLILLLVFVNSCATVPYSGRKARISNSDYIDLDSFCRKHNFEYSFDTIDDLLRIYSPDKEFKLLFNSPVGLFGGSIFYLKKPPVYLKGRILLPRQLEKIITSGELVSFTPLFTVNTIVIDPGHGGKDPGAISSRGLREKDVNLIVSRYLKQELEAMGFKVILTRNKDIFISLEERTNIAKRNNADLFISIHANANRSRKISGVEVYYLSPSRLKSQERSLCLARNEEFQGRQMHPDVKAILWDLLISKNYGFAVELSDIFYLTFKNLGFKVKPPRKASFYVLRCAYVPSILVEMGYLSNYYEEKALRKRHYQKQIAHAIALTVSSLKKRHATPKVKEYVN